MNKIKNRIIDYYNSLNNKQKMFFAIGIFLVLSFIYFCFINNSYREDEINYKDITLNKIMEKSEVTYERGKIKSLDEIVNKILKVYFNSYYIDEKSVTVKDLYNNALYSSYTKSLSYGKFKDKMNILYKNVLANEQVSFLDNKSYIEMVYYSEDYDIYIIKLKGGDHSSYIGIRLYTFEDSFKIAYIEE